VTFTSPSKNHRATFERYNPSGNASESTVNV